MRPWADYIGLPYADHGRTREGVDCWGLVRLAYHEQYDLELPSYSYGMSIEEQADEIAIQKKEAWIEVQEPAAGCVVLLRQFQLPSHVGLMISETHFIHCELDIGVTKQPIDSPRWRNRICGYYQHSMLSSVRVIACPSPLTPRREISSCEPNSTVAEIVARAIPEKWRRFAHVSVHGTMVPPASWDSARVKAGALVSINVVPRGRGRSLLRSILSIAVMVWAGGAGGRMFGRLIGGKVVGTQALAYGRAIAGAVGLLAVNALVPPPVPRFDGLSGTDQSNVYSIRGAQNRVNQYGAVPIVLGTHRIYPPYAAKPYTMLDGDDQYLCCLFAIGYGPLSISELKIGETAIASFADVEYEIKEGTAGDTAVTLFPEAVDEQQLNIALTYAAGAQTRTTIDDTDEVAVDITFPQGLVRYTDSGAPTNRVVAFELAYRTFGGGGAWSNPLGYYVSALTVANNGSGYDAGVYGLVFTGGGGSGAAGQAHMAHRASKLGGISYVASVVLTSHGNGYTSAPTISLPPAAGGEGAIITAGMAAGFAFDAKSTKPKRYGFHFDLPSRGKYDVRCTRTSADSTDTKDVDAFYWTALRSIKNEAPVSTAYHLAKVAIKIKATGQLNGIIETFSCLAKSRCVSWSGAAWVADQETQNPADLYRYLLQGPFNAAAVADGRVDLSTLETWADFCIAKGFKFNAVLDSIATLADRLAMVTATGRASFGMIDNKYSVVIDDTQATAVQLFTPRNIKSFSANRAFIGLPHAFRCRFINENNDYLQEERVVYRDGFNSGNATLFERLELFGVTDSDLVWKLARYHMAVATHRQESFVIELDAEHLVCTRGDLVSLLHDAPLLGIAAGRVKEVNDDWIRVDEICTMGAGPSYAVDIRKADGALCSRDLVTSAGDNKILTRSGGAAFDCSVGDLFLFGEAGTVDLECLVRTIEHMPDMAARLTLVPYVAAVYTADSGVIPAYSAQMTLPDSLKPPNPPRVLAVSEFLYREDGTMEQGVVVSWYHADDTVPDGYEAQILRPSVDEWEAAGVSTRSQQRIDMVPSGVYSFRVRTLLGLRSSEWVTLADESIDDLSGDISNVTDLRTAYRDSRIVMTWTRVDDVRSIEYEIRIGTSWDAGTLLVVISANEYFPLTDATYMVKARSGGAYSTTAASVAIVGIDLPANVIESVDERAEGWAGTFTGGAYPQMPTSFDDVYRPGWTLDFDAWDVEYDGAVEPDAAVPVWILHFADHASSDGDILTIGPIPMGQACGYYRVIAPVAGQIVMAIARMKIEAGQLNADFKVRSAALNGAVSINYSSDTQIRVNGGAAITIGDCTKFHDVVVELTDYWYTIHVNDELVDQGTPAAWAVDNVVYFGVSATGAKRAYWDYVNYGIFDAAAGDLNAKPDDPGPGWTLVGTDQATVKGDYLQIRGNGVNDCAYGKAYSPAAVQAVVLEAKIDNPGNKLNAWLRIKSGALGTEVNVYFTSFGTIDIYGAAGPPIDSIVMTDSAVHDVSLILDTSRYWFLIDGRPRSAGVPGSAIGGTGVWWGNLAGSAGGQKWYYARAAIISNHAQAMLVDGLENLVSYYTTDSGNQVDLGVDGVVIAAAAVGYHGSDVSTDLVASADLVAEDDLLYSASAKVAAEPQIRIKEDGGTWQDWQGLVAGQYTGRYFDTRLRVTVESSNIIAYINEFTWSIDMKDRMEQDQNVSTDAAGSAITFDTKFQVVPLLQVTQKAGVSGDTLLVTVVTVTGFTVQVLDSLGAGKAGTVDWIAKGY